MDGNQQAIVDALRSIPNVTVAVGHDDIIVGYQNRNYWFEVKNPDTAFKADGMSLKKGAIKASQEKIRRTWAGHYDIVWSLDQIQRKIGVKS